MNKSIVSLFFLVAIILLGATGYHYIERFPVIDALYMAVITISTVGFGEIYPLSTTGRLFTIGLILVGFVVLGFFGSSLVELLMERVWSGKYRGKKMKKQINRLKKHHIICGFGRVGKVAAQHLFEAGASFVVIDSSAAVLRADARTGLSLHRGRRYPGVDPHWMPASRRPAVCWP